ncbi:MAG TPA: pyruvate kinase [Bacteroidales bacterium]|jgi:pyruvate kinase|nr:pyruvate kinase [Bacteroidales bacterium]HQH25347.1 pyruvate kinase [Bacteroidales bacterium]HQJ82853.1 pyruvate kinase [Bacteroidales bacterium]
MLNRKRTKIVATISDKNCEPDFIRNLYEAGMDVVRINSAHLEIEGALRIIRNVRKVSDKIAILIDTKGPEIRTTDCDEPVNIQTGTVIRMAGDSGKKTTPEVIHVNLRSIADEVPVGSRVMIDDGEIVFRVIGKDRDRDMLILKSENMGLIGSRKSVNVPGVKIDLPSLTDKDRIFIQMAAANDIEFIAHSFVRRKQDVLDVQAEIDKYNSGIKIIAKIENQEGVENINDILDVVYGIMVARGDLAIEIPYEKIPTLQKMIISRCIYCRKPVIVATQMLHSMITNPRPTRAEVSDIASAVYSQTDALMLSGETAAGNYPVEAVRTMTKVALEVERNKEKLLETPFINVTGEISSYLAKVAVETSLRIGARGIIADTSGGRTIRDMASYRGFNLILAQCYTTRAMRELALSYGVYTSYQEPRDSIDQFIHIALSNLISEYDFRGDDKVVVLAGNFSGGNGFSFIEVGTVEYLNKRIGFLQDMN